MTDAATPQPRFHYYVASSLDGFIADADGGLEWLLQFGFETFQAHYDAFLEGIGALVMGSSTYEFILREDPAAWPYEGRPTWVLTSRDLPAIDGADIRFASGGVDALLPRIAESADGRDVWIVGGGAVASQFLEAGALDLLHLTLMPVALGRGAPLLPISQVTPVLRLVQTTPFEGGAVELRYELSR